MTSDRRQSFEALSIRQAEYPNFLPDPPRRLTWVLFSPSHKDFSERPIAIVPSNFTLSVNDTSILHHPLLPQMGSRLWKAMTGAFAVPVTA